MLLKSCSYLKKMFPLSSSIRVHNKLDEESNSHRQKEKNVCSRYIQTKRYTFSQEFLAK